MYLDCSEPTTSTDIISYICRNIDPGENTKPATYHTTYVPTGLRLFYLTENCQDASCINFKECWTIFPINVDIVPITTNLGFVLIEYAIASSHFVTFSGKSDKGKFFWHTLFSLQYSSAPGVYYKN